MSEDPRGERPTVGDDPDAPPSEEELAEAAALRAALDEGSTGDPVVEALRAAHAPRPIARDAHDAIVSRALAPRGGARRPVVLRLAGGVTAALAVAAAIAVLVRGGAAAPELARARSTQPLFDEPFKVGQASARIDRIAVARAADFRDNRFAKWGVK